MLIVLDTTRPDRLSTYGAARETSPNLDRLAQAAVVFENTHSVAPWTLPAHMSMFTGLYPGEHGATWAAFSSADADSLGRLAQTRFTFRESERLLGRRMKEAGYTTLAVSSNPWVSKGSGFDEGFDWFHDTWGQVRRRPGWYERMPDEVKVSSSVDHGRAGRTLLEFRNYFARHEVAEPFFAFFNFVDPHFPYVPPDEFKYRFGGDPEVMEGTLAAGIPDLELKLIAGEPVLDLALLVPFYDAELAYVDFVLGQLFAWLVREGYDENTMIVVTSDHGEHLGENGRFSHQLSVEEEVLRVPLMVRFPDRARAGSIDDHPLVSNMDVYETILAAAAASAMNFDRPSRSQDLGAMTRFHRDYLLAENYFSDAYLSRLQSERPEFEMDAHRIVRRAVYTPSNKYVIEGTELRGPGASSDGSGGGSAALAWLQHYVRDVQHVDMLNFGASGDASRLESLKALGYVGER